MKTLRHFSILLFLFVSNICLAQVTGKVKIQDIHHHFTNNFSGVKVLFTATSAPAVSDSVYSDSIGNFSITVVPGSYVVTFVKSGYVWGYSPSYITIPYFPSAPINIGTAIMYERPPQVVLNGNVSGTLQKFTAYFCGQATIAAGDTLIVPEGSLLNPLGLTVNGCLKVLGTDSNPSFFFTTNNQLGDSILYPIGYQGITVNAGAHLVIDHCNMTWLVMEPTGAHIDITNSYSAEDTAYYHHYGWLNGPQQSGGTSWANIYCHNSVLHVSDSHLELRIGATDFSKVTMECNYMYLTSGLQLYSGSSGYIYNNLLQGLYGYRVDADEPDTIIAIDNYFPGPNHLFLISNNSLRPTYIQAYNNTFSPSNYAFSVTGNVQLSLVNNLGLKLVGLDTTGLKPTIVDMQYNVMAPQDTAFSQFNYPSGLSILPTMQGNYDTTDSYHNRYNDFNNIFASSYDSIIFEAGADSFYRRKGDPGIHNIEGSRSDIGARYDTTTCSNPSIYAPPILGGAAVVLLNDSVWPGDANYDGMCNNADLLPIGLKYGATGPVRANASLVWTPQYCAPWNDSLASNRNIKHTDCNGDGTINYTDVNAIYQNYSLTHVVHKQQQNFGDGLWLQFPSDSMFEGDTISVAVMLGSNQFPVNNIYGLAFSITYDSAYITPNTASMKFQPCWLGTDSTNMVSFFKEIPSAFRYDVALARTDLQPVSGGGQIGSLIVVINDDILAKVPHTATAQMDFHDIYAIDQLERVKNIGSQYGTFNIQVGYVRQPVSVAEVNDEASIAIYPNPAKDKVLVQLSTIASGNISLITMDGRILNQLPISTQQTVLDIANVPNGLYLVKINTGTTVVYRKIEIAH